MARALADYSELPLPKTYMSLAYPFQKFQDWCTQQWSILWGRSFDPAKEEWLMGPFGQVGSTGDDFVYQLAEKEGLTVSRKVSDRGLIPRVQDLNLPEEEYARLSDAVIDFYQQTGRYSLQFAVEWNPFFKFFGQGVRVLFSERINQLNVPIKNLREGEEVNSEIITLSDPKSGQVRYTIWYRSFKDTGEVLYSGVYGLCTPPSGKVHVKAVFPLPKGNATVILEPAVGQNGELSLQSSGKCFGDAGFYFLLKDAKGKYWANYVKSFRDVLVVRSTDKGLLAEQTLTLWGMRVLEFRYRMERV